MQGRKRGFFGVLCCAVWAVSTTVLASDRSTESDRVVEAKCGGASRTCGGDTASPTQSVRSGANVPAGIEVVPLAPDVRLQRHVIGGDDDQTASTAGAAERLVYGNAGGRFAISPGGGNLLSDDLSLSTPGGCAATRIEFDVTGKVNPEGTGGPFSVEFFLFTVCPGSVDTDQRNSRTIVAGSELFPDDSPRTVVFNIPPGVNLPTNVWFGVRFSRPNTGLIGGLPAQEGFSQDLFDFPGSTCNANFGDFPDQPHGSFNISIWGDDDACPVGHVDYLNRQESGLSTTNPGANIWRVDDVNLLTPNCRMVAYEVVVRGAAVYDFEFRNVCASNTIAGTEKTQLVSASNSHTRSLRFDVDPPVPLPQNAWFAYKANNGNGGVVAPARGAAIGSTSLVFGVDRELGNCEFPANQPHSGLSLTVICEGEAPLGACCDMFVKECVGGESEGLTCRENSQCESPGTCEVVCRELAEANCTFPAPGQQALPNWEQGDACDPNPFPSQIVCGECACCHLNAEGEDDCINLTQNNCFEQPPLEEPRQWQRGRYCSLDGQRCPLHACLGREGECTIGRSEPGCEDPDCCTSVCNDDAFCCTTFWDSTCAELAAVDPECSGMPSNDKCSTGRADAGAREVIIGETFLAAGSHATAEETDPVVCCHNGLPKVCVEGSALGQPCEEAEDCGLGGICAFRAPRALATVWFKFEATSTSVSIDSCGSNSPALDSVIQVFDSGDPSSNETACESLIPIGCSDDVAGCASSGNNSSVCVDGLTLGRTYYFMVGAKSPATVGDYRLNIIGGCTPQGVVENDWCLSGTSIADGSTAFDLAGTTLDCPADECTPLAEQDMWFDYTATCTGFASLNSCDGNPGTGTEPDISLTVYEGCDTCPPASPRVACNQDSPETCGPDSLGSAVEFNTVVGECYKIRVSDQEGNVPSGTLNIECTNQCEAGTITFIDPPPGVLDARRPHDPFSFSPAFGIEELRVEGPPGVELPGCWRVSCETALVDGIANSIESVTEDPMEPGTYVVRLSRPITKHAFTSVRYLGNPLGDNSSVLQMTSHPANVTGNISMDAADITALVTFLNGGASPPWGRYSTDIDMSGLVTPLDLLDAIDLGNGAEFYEPTLNTVRPSTSPCVVP